MRTAAETQSSGTDVAGDAELVGVVETRSSRCADPAPAAGRVRNGGAVELMSRRRAVQDLTGGVVAQGLFDPQRNQGVVATGRCDLVRIAVPPIHRALANGLVVVSLPATTHQEQETESPRRRVYRRRSRRPAAPTSDRRRCRPPLRPCPGGRRSRFSDASMASVERSVTPSSRCIDPSASRAERRYGRVRALTSSEITSIGSCRRIR